jgi:hypothetical protein
MTLQSASIEFAKPMPNDPLKTLISHELAAEEEREPLSDLFFQQIVSFRNEQEINSLIERIGENRLTFLAKQLVENCRESSPQIEALRKPLAKRIQQIEFLKRKRDELLAGVIPSLSEARIEYVLFKTFNRYGEVGVDIDALIHKKDYTKCTILLQSMGLHPIDDLSKVYETGFMVDENPIILDLHTNVTVMGASYFSPSTIFRNAEIVPASKLDVEVGEKKITLCVLNQETNGLVLMAHSILKEGFVRASDFLEVYQSVPKDGSFERAVSEEGLDLVSEIFGRTVSRALPAASEAASRFLSCGRQSLAGELAVSYLTQARGGTMFPVKIPAPVTLLALLDSLSRRGELATAIGKAVGALRYRKSVLTVARKIQQQLGG